MFKCETKALIPPSKKKDSVLSALSSERLIVNPEFKNDSSLSLLARTSKLYLVFVKVLGLGLKLIVVPFLSDFGPFFKGAVRLSVSIVLQIDVSVFMYSQIKGLG